GTYEVRDSTLQLTADKLFIADFNSDGIVDISQFKKPVGQDTVHTLLLSDAPVEQTTIQFYQAHCFVDFEHDGRLDIIQITKPDSLHITFYQNQSAQNLGPAKPGHAIAYKIF